MENKCTGKTNESKIGLKPICMEHRELIKVFLLDEDERVLNFPPTLSNLERKAIHNYVRDHGLKSKSVGKGDDRYLTVSKPNLIRLAARPQANIAPLKLQQETVHYLSHLTDSPTTLPEQNCGFSMIEQCASLSLGLGESRKHRGQQIYVPDPITNGSHFFHERANLPIFPYRRKILDTIASNQVVIVVGETGSGKTTQVPQYILEECAMENMGCRICCTQPRRIAATSIADRVATERGEAVGSTVGYQIRLESCISQKTALTYTTSGYLLRALMGSKNKELFENITHLILDEVHEREKLTDFLLIAIRDALPLYPKLKVILMSATMNADVFSQYFNDCPVIDVPGRIFPVDIYHLGKVLHLTGYTTDAMNHFMKMSKGPKLIRESKTSKQKEHNETSGTNSISDNLINVSPEDVEFYDDCLNECSTGEDESAFEQIFYLISNENMPVNYKHSMMSLSALMIAASQDNVLAVKHLLKLGAVPGLLNEEGVSAKDIAIQNNSHESLAVMVQHESDNNIVSNVECMNDNFEEEKHNRAMQQFLATAYQMTAFKDEVNHSLVIAVIKHIHINTPKDGSILVFLPGYDDIMTQQHLVETILVEADFMLFVLHSGIGVHTADQRQVFQKMPQGIRKIILSTNIAETSVTIDDVVHVVDAGLVKLITYDSISVTTCLTCTWISQACAKQRSGRAGRTRNGVCYRLYPEDHYNAMEKYTLPELLRVPLSDICLNAKILAGNTSIEEFLMKAIQPPSILSVRQSISLLKSIGALNKDESITNLGIHLIDLPVDAQLGKCLLYAVLLNCLDPVVTIVSALSVRDPFSLPTRGDDKKLLDNVKQKFSENSFSDHRTLLNVFNDWSQQHQRGKKQFAQENYISDANMQMIKGVKSQIFRHLELAGFITPKSEEFAMINLNSNKWSVVKACLLAGSYPNLCRIKKKTGKFFAKNDRVLMAFRGSVLRSSTNDNAFLNECHTDWLIHGEKSTAGRLCLVRNISLVSALTVSIFAGPLNLAKDCIEVIKQVDSDNSCDDNEVEVEKNNQDSPSKCNFCIDEWIIFNTEVQNAKLVFGLRQNLNDILIRMIRSPKTFTKSEKDLNIIYELANVLECEERQIFPTFAQGTSYVRGQQTQNVPRSRFEVAHKNNKKNKAKQTKGNWRDRPKQNVPRFTTFPNRSHPSWANSSAQSSAPGTSGFAQSSRRSRLLPSSTSPIAFDAFEPSQKYTAKFKGAGFNRN